MTIVNPPFNTVAGDFGLDGKFGVCFTGTSGVTYEAEWASPVNGAIIVVTGLRPEEIESHGGLPNGIPVYHKPVPFAALRPVVEHMARKRVA